MLELLRHLLVALPVVSRNSKQAINFVYTVQVDPSLASKSTHPIFIHCSLPRSAPTTVWVYLQQNCIQSCRNSGVSKKAVNTVCDNQSDDTGLRVRTWRPPMVIAKPSVELLQRNYIVWYLVTADFFPLLFEIDRSRRIQYHLLHVGTRDGSRFGRLLFGLCF